MRQLAIILFVLLGGTSALGQVVKTEYFFDRDPGIGSGMALSVGAGNNISDNFTIPLTAISTGFHILYLRAQDAQGRWSHTLPHSLYVFSGNGGSIVASEYFIDTDPGYGKATPLATVPGSDSAIRFVVPLSTVSSGFHTVYIRVKDDAGQWSLTQQHAFFNKAGGDSVNITSLEYYFTGGGQTTETRTYAGFAPAPLVDLNFTADLSKLEGNREYEMHIWAVNSDGVRSEVLIQKVKVCNEQPAKAAFDFAESGTQVSFVDKSTSASSYHWDFGDGTTDSTSSNPLHNYDSVGVYSVALTISNVCNSDTVKKSINIVGLKSIYTNHGGSKGSVTVDIRGAGFVAGMKLFLHRNGEQDIYGDTLTIRDVGLINTTFNLAGKAKGLWDVIAAFPDGKSDTLHNTFTVEDGTEPKLWVNINGPGILRIGFNQIYTVTYGNDGNTDAVYVPILISGLPLGSEIQLLNPLLKLDSLATLDSLGSPITHTVDDSLNDASFRMFFLIKIPANSTGVLNFVFHLPSNTALHTYPLIKAIIGGSTADLYIIKQQNMRTSESSWNFNALADCTSELLVDIASDILEEIVDVPNIKTCALGVAQTFSSFLKIKLKENETKLNVENIIDMTDYNIGLFKTISSCVQALEGVIIPEAKIAKMALKALKVLSYGIQGYNIYKSCSQVYKPEGEGNIRPIVGNAWDPNQKYGPGDSSGNHYTNTGVISYVINFENDPKANLNAQTVTVIDTLNRAYYDYSSFGFTSVTVGDSTFPLSSPVPSFIHDFNFTSLYGVKARVVATFDTTTGIAQWKFFTIDPLTNQITKNALAGFLPPDKISPKGQGYVSFIVRQHPNIKTGDTIYNKATIKFDYNPDITTNSWQNVFDLIKPVSKVQALPAEVHDTSFTVKWSGTDNASGIRSYDIYYAFNNGTFQLWLSDVTLTEAVFTGQKDSTYRFYSIAKDFAGNIEGPKTTAETSTVVNIGHITPVPNVPVTDFTFRNFPNPAENGVWLEFTLPVPQQVRITLADMAGRQIGIIADKPFAPGTHRLFYDLHHLQAGFYIGALQSKRFRQSIKIFKR